MPRMTCLGSRHRRLGRLDMTGKDCWQINRIPAFAHELHDVREFRRVPDPLRRVDALEDSGCARDEVSLNDNSVKIPGRNMHTLRTHDAVAIRDPRLRNLSREELGRTGREREFRMLPERPEALEVLGGE